MATDDFSEYSRFFDFSKSDANYKLEELDDNQLSKLNKNEGYIEIVDEGNEEEEKGGSDDDWEDEDDEEEENNEGEENKGDEGSSEKKEGMTTEGNAKTAFRKAKKDLKVKRLRVPKIEVLESGEIRLANGNM